MSLPRALRKLAADESGATAVEYALIASAIAGVIVAIIFVFGGKVKNQYSNVSTHMP